jgi:Tfp pilus assembly protein PilZ
MEDSDQTATEFDVTAQLIEHIKNMSMEQQVKLLREFDKDKSREVRQHDRKAFLMIIDYAVEDRYYRDFIEDMSASGVFIKTSQSFSVGQTILMTFMSPDYQQPFKISGEIARVTPAGIGVKFKIESQVQEAVIQTLVKMIQNG